VSTNKKRKVYRWSLAIALLFIAAIAAVLVTGQIARHNLAKRYPPPGVMISSQGHRLHLHCEGQGPVTILLEAGLNEFSIHWYKLQSLLAQKTKTCAYDRAGLGWSEPSAQPATIDNAVMDLRSILQTAGANQPIILVGHSYGTLLVRLYARRYPQNIKAMILLDPANENMAEAIQGYGEVTAAGTRQFKTFSLVASLGLMALATDSIPAGQLQGEAVAQYRAALAAGSFFKGAEAETGEMVNNLHAMQTYAQKSPSTVPNTSPVIIISRGQPEPMPGLPEKSARSLEQTWSQLQTDLVNRLHAKQIIAEKSGHHVQLSQPELVYETIVPFINDNGIDAGSPSEGSGSK
jgi:pimeloyl-ACP methyl ester carboxylesterase